MKRGAEWSVRGHQGLSPSKQLGQQPGWQGSHSLLRPGEDPAQCPTHVPKSENHERHCQAQECRGLGRGPPKKVTPLFWMTRDLAHGSGC